jgi:hypothetical protein
MGRAARSLPERSAQTTRTTIIVTSSTELVIPANLRISQSTLWATASAVGPPRLKTSAILWRAAFHIPQEKTRFQTGEVAL